jgi:hypothetical protein
MKHDFDRLANVPEKISIACQFQDILEADLGKVIASVATGSFPVILSTVGSPGGNYDLSELSGRGIRPYGIAVILSVPEFLRLSGHAADPEGP